MPALPATSRLVAVALLVLLLVAAPALALEVPSAPQGRVSDYSGALTVDQRRNLEQKLARFEEETANQVAVVVIPTLAGDNLEDYSIRLAEKWRLGRKGRDNGVILLVVMQDRKIRIEVGYGLEGMLPDSLAGEIIRQEIASRFRQDQFYQGIEAGVAAIMAATKGEYRPAPRTGASQSWIWVILFVLFLLAATAGNSRRRPPYSRRGRRVAAGPPFWWGGGYGGGGFSGGSVGGGFSGGGGGFGGGGASGGW